MGIAERDVYDSILCRPNSRDNGCLSDLKLWTIRLVLNFCCKIVTVVADPVPLAREISKLLDIFRIRGTKF